MDNGSAFRSTRLKYACARLGVALLHSAPYTPEGRGKIERFFRTVRMQLIPLLGENLSLEKINEHLHAWLDGDYHQRIHSSTGQTPLQRYLAHLSLLRSAPRDLCDYFRVAIRRKVDKDRTVTVNGNLFEAPVGFIGKYVTLLYHPHDSQRVEVLFEEQSQGFLVPLNGGVNSRVRRVARQSSELVLPQEPPAAPPYRGGSLFQKGSTP